MYRHCKGVLPRRTGDRQEGDSRGASLRPAAVWVPQAPVPILRGRLGPVTMRPLTCAGSRSHRWPEQVQRAAPAFLGLFSHSARLHTCLGTRPPRPAVPHLRMDWGRTGQARQGCWGPAGRVPAAWGAERDLGLERSHPGSSGSDDARPGNPL